MDIVHKLISKEAGSSSQEYEMLSMENGGGAPGDKRDEMAMVSGGAGDMTMSSSLDVNIDADVESQGLGTVKARRNGNAANTSGGVSGPNGGAAPNTVNYEKVQTLCLITISGVLTVAAMQHLRAVMVPLVLAFLVSYPLTAVVDFIYVRGGCPKVRSSNQPPRSQMSADTACGPREDIN